MENCGPTALELSTEYTNPTFAVSIGKRLTIVTSLPSEGETTHGSELEDGWEDRTSNCELRSPKRMAGAAGLEPVTSAVTGQRSNQLSYAPAWGRRTYGNTLLTSSRTQKNIRAADAKEVGVGNPAEETYCYPNNEILCPSPFLSTPRAMMLIILMRKGASVSSFWFWV
jgi:hypothetical protein